MSEAMSQTLNVGVTTTVQLELKPLYIILSNKSPYDIQISGYGIVGIAWIAAGTAEKLNGMVYNSGVLNMTPFNTANINPAGPAAILLTQYLPSDPEPKGIYPVSIPFQTVNTSNNVTTSQTLSNEINTSQTLVIDIGEVGHTLLITINSDGTATWSVLQSGVSHQAIKVQNSGNPLLLGQSGDITEILGTLQLDNAVLIAPGSSKTFIDGSGSDTYIAGRGATNFVHIGYNGATTGFTEGARIGSGGILLSQGAMQFLTGSISRINGGVATCGSGTTISHGLSVTPDLISGTPVGNQPFSATVGIGNAGATTFQATIGAGSQIDWTAIKG